MSQKKQEALIKKNALTLQQRLELLNKLNNGQSVQDLADQYFVHRSTIYRVKKYEEKILQNDLLLKSCNGNLKKKRFKGAETSPVEQSLYKWFQQCRGMHLPITGAILQKKALFFHKKIYGNTKFKASDGWLRGFKQRHGVRSISMHGEKCSADIPASEDFKIKFLNLLEISGFTLDQIYNCDETALYWKMLPNRTLAGSNEKKASGTKKANSRLTIMACTNASGTHKLPLYMIGKSKKPRCVNGVKKSPVAYRHQDNAWMDEKLMIDWYTTIFLPDVKRKHDIPDNICTNNSYNNNNERPKTILIMDNAKVHPPEDVFNSLSNFCTVYFLPPNVTSLIQPLNQGIIEKFKKCYKKRFLEIIAKAETIEQVDYALESFNVIDCMDLCFTAWNEVTSIDIRNCWKYLIPLGDNSNLTCTATITQQTLETFQEVMSRIPGFDDILGENVDEWLSADNEPNGETGWQVLTEEEIIDEVIVENPKNYRPELGLQNTNEIDCHNSALPNDQTIVHDDIPKVSVTEAYRAVNTLKNFCQWNEDEEAALFLPALEHFHRHILHNFSDNKN